MNSPRWILIASVLGMLIPLSACADDNSMDATLITPGSTVLSYCNSGEFDQNSKYFNLEPAKGNSAKRMSLGWKNCRILKEEPTSMIGKTVETDRIAVKGDVEVTLEVDTTDKTGKIYPQQYWFLLHKYSIGWQIISYNLIGD